MAKRNRSNDSTRLAKLAERQFAMGDKRAALASLKLLFDLARREGDCGLEREAGAAVRRVAGEIGAELEPRFRNRKGRRAMKKRNSGFEHHRPMKSMKKRNARPKVKVRVKTKVTVKVRNSDKIAQSIRAHKEIGKAIEADRKRGEWRAAESHARKALFLIRKIDDEKLREANMNLFGAKLRSIAAHGRDMRMKERGVGPMSSSESRKILPSVRNCGIRNAKFWGN